MQSILVPLDGSPFGEYALPAALAVARIWSARLDLVHVHQLVAKTISPAGMPFFDPSIDLELRQQEETYLRSVVNQIAKVWDGVVTYALVDSPTVAAICLRAHDIGAGLIVLSTHGRGGVARAWLGNVADRVIRQAKIPTLTIHPGTEEPRLSKPPDFDHILIPLDGSALAEEALTCVAQLRGDTPAHYDLVRVVEPITHGLTLSGIEPIVDVEAQERAWKQASEYLDHVAAPLRAQGHVVMTYVPIGHIAYAILDRADVDGMSMIAMTTHGRGGVARMIVGSVTDKVVRSTNRPVLIYRPPDTA